MNVLPKMIYSPSIRFYCPYNFFILASLGFYISLHCVHLFICVVHYIFKRCGIRSRFIIYSITEIAYKIIIVLRIKRRKLLIPLLNDSIELFFLYIWNYYNKLITADTVANNTMPSACRTINSLSFKNAHLPSPAANSRSGLKV